MPTKDNTPKPTLLPCPCCAGKGKSESLNYFRGRPSKHKIHCVKCGLSTKFFTYLKAAYNSWNNRHHG